MNKTTSRFNQKELIFQLQKKMFSTMKNQNRKIGLREFATDSKTSASTLSRILTGKEPDINTFCLLVIWLKSDPKIFILK